MNSFFILILKLSNDKLKSFITDTEMKIEPKGQKSYFIENYMNIMATTNNVFTLKVEEGCRRSFVLEVSNHLIGDFDYFNKLVLHAFNQDNANHFFTYLKNYKIEINLKVIPQTELKSLMAEMSLSTPKRFYASLKESIPKEYTVIEHNGNIYMKSEDLYVEYKEWCFNCGEKVLSLNAFRSELRDKNEKFRMGDLTIRAVIIKKGKSRERDSLTVSF